MSKGLFQPMHLLVILVALTHEGDNEVCGVHFHPFLSP
jgi:hypothetical protein